jgi:DNA polymerase
MFHPSYLLRNEATYPGSPKDLTWKDIITLKKAIDDLGSN